MSGLNMEIPTLATTAKLGIEDEPTLVSSIWKVLRIFAKSNELPKIVGDSDQIYLQSWDGAPLILAISKNLAQHIHQDDVLLLEQRPLLPIRVIGVIEGNEAKEIWETYHEHFKNLKTQQEKEQTAAKPKPGHDYR